MAVIDYNRVFREIQRLQTVASELERVQDEARRVFSDMHVYWEGAAANEFLLVNERWQNETRAISTEINAIAASIQNVLNTL